MKVMKPRPINDAISVTNALMVSVHPNKSHRYNKLHLINNILMLVSTKIQARNAQYHSQHLKLDTFNLKAVCFILSHDCIKYYFHNASSNETETHEKLPALCGGEVCLADWVSSDNTE